MSPKQRSEIGITFHPDRANGRLVIEIDNLPQSFDFFPVSLITLCGGTQAWYSMIIPELQGMTLEQMRRAAALRVSAEIQKVESSFVGPTPKGVM